MAKKKQIKKKKFMNMEITRVKMNPDQAVLTCCAQAGREFGPIESAQCGGACGPSAEMWLSS